MAHESQRPMMLRMGGALAAPAFRAPMMLRPGSPIAPVKRNVLPPAALYMALLQR